jgi:ribonuclease-3
MRNETMQFEKRISYYFRKKDLLLRALTHSSYAYENPDRAKDNELLEFLGDSVIGLIAADFVYAEYPEATEGDLSKLKSSASSTIALADFAREIKLDKFIRLGKGEERSGGRTKNTILAGGFEGLLGAVYLDGGFEAARTFFYPFLLGSFRKIKSDSFEIHDYKSALQEFLLKEGLPAPHYKTLTAAGPQHKRVFIVEVYANRTSLAKAKGSSRKAAEQKAAEKALKSFFGEKIKSVTAETFMFKK